MGKWDDPEYRRAYLQTYNAARSVKQAAYNRSYRKAHRDRLLANDKVYAAAHREEARESARAWYQAHKARPGRIAPAAVRFWRQVQKTATCWLWTGAPACGGYGQFRAASGAPKILSHRFSYELHFGPIPDGLDVLHRCDVPACVRPDHLRIGTHIENMADMVTKGRSRRRSKAAV